ncbi:MAG: DUF1289 domain-containing protein [Gammaproteobacteria bacterium]|nr:MAG: DUF1289 domain-containing protein [Gammaproteobacteria bacterium]
MLSRKPAPPHPDSPCVGVCKVQAGYCSGCGRTLDEITEWFTATAARKRDILARLDRAK